MCESIAKNIGFKAMIMEALLAVVYFNPEKKQ